MSARSDDAVARAMEVFRPLVVKCAMPDGSYTGELSVTLHINGGALNHITENSQESDDRGDVHNNGNAHWNDLRRQTLDRAVTLLSSRLQSVFGERNYHGDVTLHLPMIGGACKMLRISSRRVHKVTA